MKCLVVSHFTILIVCINVWINICTGENGTDAKREAIEEKGRPLEKSCPRRNNSLAHGIKVAEPKQFPFMAAVMSLENNYLCSGALVSNGMIVTTAKCTTMPVNYVLLDTTALESRAASAKFLVNAVYRFPAFSSKSDTIGNVGIIYVEKIKASVASKIKLSNMASYTGVHDIECIGFGLNTGVGEPKVMQYIGLEVRAPIENGYTLNAYMDCINTTVPSCFKDSGGPAILDNELLGVVMSGQEDCTKPMYVTNKKMTKIIPVFTFKTWLIEKIYLNEMLMTEENLSVYPIAPQPSQSAHHSETTLTRSNPELYVRAVDGASAAPAASYSNIISLSKTLLLLVIFSIVL